MIFVYVCVRVSSLFSRWLCLPFILPLSVSIVRALGASCSAVGLEMSVSTPIYTATLSHEEQSFAPLVQHFSLSLSISAGVRPQYEREREATSLWITLNRQIACVTTTRIFWNKRFLAYSASSDSGGQYTHIYSHCYESSFSPVMLIMIMIWSSLTNTVWGTGCPNACSLEKSWM